PTRADRPAGGLDPARRGVHGRAGRGRGPAAGGTGEAADGRGDRSGPALVVVAHPGVGAGGRRQRRRGPAETAEPRRPGGPVAPAPGGPATGAYGRDGGAGTALLVAGREAAGEPDRGRGDRGPGPDPGRFRGLPGLGQRGDVARHGPTR